MPALYYLRGFDNSSTHRATLLHWTDGRLEQAKAALNYQDFDFADTGLEPGPI